MAGALPGPVAPPAGRAILLGLLILAGCAAPRSLGEERAWLNTYNGWNRSLDGLNSVAARDAPQALRGLRALRDSARAAADTLGRVPPRIGRARLPALFTFLQRTRFNVLATEHRRLSARRDLLADLARRATQLDESGDFGAARLCEAAFERGADSLRLAVNALLDEDRRSAWDTLQAPLPPRSSADSWLAPRLRLAGDSIPPDPGEARGRLEQIEAYVQFLRSDAAFRRPAAVRRGWVHRANALVEGLNAAVRVDSTGAHRDALVRLAVVHRSTDSTLAALLADTTRWPGRLPAGAASPRARVSVAPSDPESALRDVVRLVNLNEEAIRHGLAVQLYQDISRRLALGGARPRSDGARLDSTLADPRLDPDLRRMMIGLREDLNAARPPAGPPRR